MKFYAVKKGRKNGIFTTWKECEDSVKGYPGAEFKSFKTEEEAKEYLTKNPNRKETIKSLKENELGNARSSNKTILPKGEAVAYVDGSYNKEKNIYGSGIVFFYEEKQLNLSRKGEDQEMLQMWNVAGEVEAAMYAMTLAKNLGLRRLTIYHDYNGIAGWVVGVENKGVRSKVWEANKPGAQKYKKFAKEIANNLELDFIKVAAHTGNKYNELADELAKTACDIH